MRPFRFGTYPFPFNLTNGKVWIKHVQEIEKLGYSTLMYPDHFPKRIADPITLLASAAATTKTLNIGTLVFDIDFRHPAILAKTATSLHILSQGRYEFGIGAGWMKEDYDWTGIPYDPPYKRIKRLEEGLKIIKSMWTIDKTTFNGKHYKVTDIPQAGELSEGEQPKIIVGGGGKMLLKVAGRHADIVGIHVNLHDRSTEGRIAAHRTASYEEINKRIKWVKDSALASGRDPEKIEFQMLCPFVEITDDPDSVLEQLTESYDGQISVDEFWDSPRVLVGSGSFVREKVVKLRAETGINYIIAWPRTKEVHELFSKEVIKPLTK